jgi:hypothetical protein
MTTEVKFVEATGRITAVKLSDEQIKQLKRFVRRLMSGAEPETVMGQLDPTLIPIAVGLMDRMLGTTTRWRIEDDRLVPMEIH